MWVLPHVSARTHLFVEGPQLSVLPQGVQHLSSCLHNLHRISVTHTVCKIKWVKPVKECLIFCHPSPVTVVDVHYKRSEMSSIIKTWRWSRLTLSLDLCWYPPVSRCLRCRLKLWRSPCCGWWLHAACNRLMPPCRLTAQWDCRQAAGSPDPAWRTFLQVERQTEQKVWICS